jgi:hypothetical protein
MIVLLQIKNEKNDSIFKLTNRHKSGVKETIVAFYKK